MALLKDYIMEEESTDRSMGRCTSLKAWEDNVKAKLEYKAHRKLSIVGSWETSQRAYMEAQMKMSEEKVEPKMAEYVEKKTKNKMAEIHKAAEEMKSVIEARREKECMEVKEIAARYQSDGNKLRKYLGCFGS